MQPLYSSSLPSRLARIQRFCSLAGVLAVLTLLSVTTHAAKGETVASEVFDALVGETVTLTATDGTVTQGILKAVAGPKLIMILSDGNVVVRLKTSIAAINVGAQASVPAPTPTVDASKLPPECAQLPSLLAKVQTADQQVAVASQACGVVGEAVGGAVADQIGSLLGLGGIGKSLTQSAMQSAASTGCETASESAIYDGLLEQYDQLVAKCEGSGATPYVSANAGVHAAAAKRPKKSDYLKAVEAGDVEKAKELLKTADEEDRMFEESSYDTRCDLWYAVKNRDLPMVKLLTESHTYVSGGTCLPHVGHSDTRLVHNIAAVNGDMEILDLLMQEGVAARAWVADESGLSPIDHVAKIEGATARKIQAEMESYARREEDSYLDPLIGWSLRGDMPLIGVRSIHLAQHESANGLSALEVWFGQNDDKAARMKTIIGGNYGAWDRRLYSSDDGTGQVFFSLGVGVEYREIYKPLGAGDTGLSHGQAVEGMYGKLDFVGQLNLAEEWGALPVSLTYELHTNGSGGIDIGIQTFVMEITETLFFDDEDEEETSEYEVSFFSLENVNLFARFRLF